MALTNKLTNIADAIRTKTGSTATMTLDEMASAISNIETGGGSSGGEDIPEEAFDISDDCSYMFYHGDWDWFARKYANRISTHEISKAENMFGYSQLDNIPFVINLKNNCSSLNNMFYTSNIKSVPNIVFQNDITNYALTMKDMFGYCYYLLSIPDIFENVNISKINNDTSSIGSAVFGYCYALRSISESLLSKLYNKATSYNNAGLYNMFYNCHCLDEVKRLGVPQGTIASAGSLLSTTFQGCSRIKSITFDVNDDGSAKTARFKGVIFNVTVGHASDYTSANRIVQYGYESGIDWSKAVYNDESYQRLKNDPNWFSSGGYNNGSNLTTSMHKDAVAKKYSRYNHDSAVETINSLPDTSAYLASAGGTNTIRFYGDAGSATDGGAINTLTTEEIAVATEKGWTVTFT